MHTDPQHPVAVSPALLLSNLQALASVNRPLADRLCLPVDGSHVEFDAGGGASYRLQLSRHPFALADADLSRAAAAAAGAESIFVFGIGLGEQTAFLLRHSPQARITVWDRDPWLIRLALERHDLGAELRSGRLRLALGADLLDYCARHRAPPAASADVAVVEHPLLRQLYGRELTLLREGVRDRRALLCKGWLFVDDLAQALRQAGYSLYTLDVQGLAEEELALTLMRFRPDFVAAVNYTEGLAEFCQARGTRLMCWEIDATTDNLRPCGSETDQAYIFTYRKSHVAEYQAAGYRHAEYLPLAADPERRAPVAGARIAGQDTPISFVGSSMALQVSDHRDRFLRAYAEFHGGGPGAAEEGRRILAEVLGVQRKDFSRYLVPELLQRRCPEFCAAAARRPGTSPVKLAGHIAASDKRLAYGARLGELGLLVWGDEGWRGIERSGARYMGLCGHGRELTTIYSASRVNLDINCLFQPDMITLRVFEILACGGFVIAEYSEALAELFRIGTDLEAYRTLDELGEKLRYYLDHDEEARAIARQGRRTVERHHTIALRVRYMLSRIGAQAGPL